MRKKIIILIATYNGEKYLEKQLKSLIDNVEYNAGHEFAIEIFDDCSQDNTINILKVYEKKYSYIQIKSTTKTGSALKNFERAINESSEGDFYFFCDQDDIWAKDKISLFLEEFEKYENNKPIAIHSDLFLVNESDEILYNSMFETQKIYKDPTLNQLLLSNSVTGCALACNYELINRIRKRDISEAIMHDWYIAIYAKIFGYLIFIDSSTVYYRQHQNNVVGAKPVSISTYSASDKERFSKAYKSLLKSKHQAELFKENNGKKNKEVEEFVSYFNRSLIERLFLFCTRKVAKRGWVKSLGLFFVYVLYLGRSK